MEPYWKRIERQSIVSAKSLSFSFGSTLDPKFYIVTFSLGCIEYGPFVSFGWSTYEVLTLYVDVFIANIYLYSQLTGEFNSMASESII